MKQLLPNTFQVGYPTNEAQIALGNGRFMPCLVPHRDYSGGDTEIQLPLGYHAKAGRGSAWSGSYHQDINNFEPYRIRCASWQTDSMFPLNHRGNPENMVRMIGGSPDKPVGSAMLGANFEPMRWSDKPILVAGIWLMPTFDDGHSLYFNFELRGKLDFTPVQEGSLCMGVALKTLPDGYPERGQIVTHWWRDGVDGQNHNLTQRELARKQYIAPNDWYNARIIATPTVNKNEWMFAVKVRSLDTDFKYEFAPTVFPNNIEYIDSINIGDEQENMGSGGRWYLSQVNVRTTETDEEREDWLEQMNAL